MTEVLFYHLQRQPLEAVLPILIERSRERGWTVVVQAATEERLHALDDHLWTFSDDGFLPHGTDAEPDPAGQPVLLTLGDGNGNAANIRFLVEGAPLPTDAAAYDRIVVLFDGEDESALAHAREQWRAVRTAGLEGTYWQQDPGGRWQKKG